MAEVALVVDVEDVLGEFSYCLECLVAAGERAGNVRRFAVGERAPGGGELSYPRGATQGREGVVGHPLVGEATASHPLGGLTKTSEGEAGGDAR